MTFEDACRRARMDLGGVDAAREDHRDARRLPTIESIRQDVSYALRGFVRDPGLSDPSDAATLANMPPVGDPDRSPCFRDGLLEEGRPAECVIAASHDRARTMAYRFGGGGRRSTAYRGSLARLRRIRMRGNSPARVWALLVFALLLVFVVIPWVIRHPLPRHEHLFGVSERHQRR
jgi:hypothetical protein